MKKLLTGLFIVLMLAAVVSPITSIDKTANHELALSDPGGGK